jgi:hypothetical protein
VTRFGEISPNGWLFTLDSFFNYKRSPLFVLLFPQLHEDMHWFWHKMDLASLSAIF